jgi:hypothetical protein
MPQTSTKHRQDSSLVDDHADAAGAHRAQQLVGLGRPVLDFVTFLHLYIA